MNVGLHRLIGVSGTEFDDKELTRGAQTIANRYIPKALRTLGNWRRANELLAKVFAIVLRAMYRKGPFLESAIRSLLYGLELPDEVTKALPIDSLSRTDNNATQFWRDAEAVAFLTMRTCFSWSCERLTVTQLLHNSR